MQKKDKVSNDQRTTKICETEVNNKIDFAYKVILEEFKNEVSTDVYTVRVVQVIKEGTSDVGPLNKLRTFLSYSHCRESLDLIKGKEYLIMGASTDIHRDDQEQLYQYILGERTWIEYWPTAAEGQMDEYRDPYFGIREMESQYETFGCQQ